MSVHVWQWSVAGAWIGYSIALAICAVILLAGVAVGVALIELVYQITHETREADANKPGDSQ